MTVGHIDYTEFDQILQAVIPVGNNKIMATIYQYYVLNDAKMTINHEKMAS